MAKPGPTKIRLRRPYARRVDSISNFNRVSTRGDEIVVKPLYTADKNFDAGAIEDIRRVALGERELVHRLISPQGDVAGISVIVVVPDGRRTAIPEIAAHARGLVERWRKKYPHLDIKLTGGVIADMTFAEAGERDFITLAPIMAALIFIALVIGLDSIAVTVATLILVLFAAAAAIGFAGWAGMECVRAGHTCGRARRIHRTPAWSGCG